MEETSERVRLTVEGWRVVRDLAEADASPGRCALMRQLIGEVGHGLRGWDTGENRDVWASWARSWWATVRTFTPAQQRYVKGTAKLRFGALPPFSWEDK